MKLGEILKQKGKRFGGGQRYVISVGNDVVVNPKKCFSKKDGEMEIEDEDVDSVVITGPIFFD